MKTVEMLTQIPRVTAITWKTIMLVIVLGVALSPIAADAHTPEVLRATPIDIPERGFAGRIRGALELYNPDREAVSVEIPEVRSPLGFFASASPGRVDVGGGGRERVELQITLRSDGKYRVLIPLLVRDMDGNLIGNAETQLCFRVVEGVYYVESYESLFVNPVSIERDEDGSPVQMYAVGPEPAGFTDSDEFRMERASVEELEAMSRDSVFKMDWAERASPTIPLPPPSGDVYRGSAPSQYFDMAAKSDSFGYATDDVSGPTAPDPNAMTAQGTLKYTGTDGLLHPCYAWRVYAFAVLEGTSTKMFLAKGNVKSNGTWSLSVPFMPAPYKVKIEYQPRNIYFTIKNISGAYYSFSSGALHTPAPGKTLNEFTQVAYLANDSLVGLGEIYKDGMLLWNALKNKGGGISPVRQSGSINVFFPNTFYDCGNGDFIPTTCTNTDGNLWIASQHATNRLAFLHELGHQLNYEYWDNDLPPNSSGTHSLDGCFTDGLALIEGFADFISQWARYSGTTIPSGDGSMIIESPPKKTCTSKNLNERWVAATFWDLYDEMNDNQDTFSFSNKGSTVGIYLQSGQQDSMSDYRSIYKLFVPDINSWSKVDDIFNQNHQ